MKVINRILTVAVLCMTAFFFIPCVSNAETAYTPKDVTVYNNSETDTTVFSCMFRDDMPNVPYVNVEDFLDLLFIGSDYNVKADGDIFTVSGSSATAIGSTATFNTSTETVSFDDYENFIVSGVSEKEDGFMDVRIINVVNPHTLDYDFSKYGIDLYSSDGKLYLPMTTITDLFNYSYAFMDYIDGCIYLARLDSQMEIPGFIRSKEKEYMNTTTREADLADYSYRELCFMMDNLYGKPDRAIGKDFIARLKKTSFDKALDAGGKVSDISTKKLKKYLQSTNKSEYLAGLVMLDYLLLDGGHTSICYPLFDVLSNDADLNAFPVTKGFSQIFKKDASVMSSFMALLFSMGIRGETKSIFEAQRKKGFGSPVKTWKYPSGKVVSSLYIKNKTAVFSFDDFIEDVIISESGKKPFNEALEYAKKKKCTNFVIDLSTNGGGSTNVENYIMCMITGKDYVMRLKNIHSGSTTEYGVRADRNLDGVIDEKDDKVKYDFNYAVLESRISYSCGNSTPYAVKEAGFAVLGETSGGGACCVSTFGTPESYGYFPISGTLVSVNSKYKTIDAGTKPNYVMVKDKKDGTINASKLYNIKKIEAKLKKFYTKKKK